MLLRISKFFVTIQGINNCRKHKVTEKLWSLLLIVFALYGCVGAPTKANKKFSNVQQENFDNMLARNKDKSYHLGNKILEKEFNDSVKLAMGEYMDSVKLFVNWKAQIQNINSRETGKSIALSFELEYAPEQYRKVTFDVDYILPQDSINTDKIYQTIRSLNNYSTVYFVGYFYNLTHSISYRLRIYISHPQQTCTKIAIKKSNEGGARAYWQVGFEIIDVFLFRLPSHLSLGWSCFLSNVCPRISSCFGLIIWHKAVRFDIFSNRR